jgi:hypothetical protein
MVDNIFTLPAMYGTAPPAWARINRILGYFFIDPFNTSEKAVLVVSKQTSIIASGKSRCEAPKPGGVAG